MLSKMNDTLRTAKLPSELLSQKNRVIKVRIGKPISATDQNQYEEIPAFSNFFVKKPICWRTRSRKQGKKYCLLRI